MSAVKLIQAPIHKRASAETIHRAASILRVRDVSDARREITGIATTPRLDRQQDIVESAGLKFQNPLPLLLYHDHRQPVGKAWLEPTDGGIAFRAVIPDVKEPGRVKDRVDEAWHSLAYSLIGATSIGFRSLGDEELLPDGGIRFTKGEVVELSLCVVPANPDAIVTGVKSVDAELRREVHGSSGMEGRGMPVVLTREQQQDLRLAAARRALGKSASRPATNEMLYITAKKLHEQDRTIAQAVAELDDRLKALESGRESGGATRSHPGSVRLIRVVR